MTTSTRGLRPEVFSPDRATQRVQSAARDMGTGLSSLSIQADRWLPVAGGLLVGTASTRVDVAHGAGVKKAFCADFLLTIELDLIMPDDRYIVSISPAYRSSPPIGYYTMRSSVDTARKKRDKIGVRATLAYVDGLGAVTESGLNFQADDDWEISFLVMRGK